MSSRNRRRKAKLARLARMDANYLRLYLMASPHRDPARSLSFWMGCIVPLGDALERKKPGAWDSLPRCPGGENILMNNYHRRAIASGRLRVCAGCDGAGGFITASWIDPVSGPESEGEMCTDCDGTGIEQP